MTQENILVSPQSSACLKPGSPRDPCPRPAEPGDTASHVARISQSARLNLSRYFALFRGSILFTDPAVPLRRTRISPPLYRTFSLCTAKTNFFRASPSFVRNLSLELCHLSFAAHRVRSVPRNQKFS